VAIERLSYRGAMVATLLLIDVQRNMLEPPHRVPCAERVLSLVDGLIERARAAGAAVVHVRHDGAPDDPDLSGAAGRKLLRTPIRGEAVVEKPGADAFAGTGLARLIPPGSVVVTAGLASGHCVRATVLSGLRQGYAMRLVRGGHGAFGEADGPGETIGKEIERELREAGAEIVEPRTPLFGVA
jgi:nicotinamidase-related amidase